MEARGEIPQGHKIAVERIRSGEQVIKYGFPIGHATEDVEAGSWVHTHNMATNLEGETEYRYEPDLHPPVPVEPETFMGYRRRDGRAAIRNEIWVLPTVGCVNDVAKKIAKDNQKLVQGSIDGLYAFPHPFGCSQTGHDHAQTRKLRRLWRAIPMRAPSWWWGLAVKILPMSSFFGSWATMTRTG